MQRNEKEKKCWGLGKREGSGRKCLAAATVILEKGFRLISLTWLIIPAESMLASQETASSHSRVSLPPEAGSRLPPVPATSPRRYLGAAGNLRGPAPRGRSRSRRAEPAPRLLPAPLPSSLRLLLRSLPVSAPEKKKKKKVTPAALQLSPKGEGETTQEATPSPRAPGPGRGRGNQRHPQVVSLFFSSARPCLGAAPRPGQARPRVLLQGSHPRSLQLPSSARG